MVFSAQTHHQRSACICKTRMLRQREGDVTLKTLCSMTIIIIFNVFSCRFLSSGLGAQDTNSSISHKLPSEETKVLSFRFYLLWRLCFCVCAQWCLMMSGWWEEPAAVLGTWRWTSRESGNQWMTSTMSGTWRQQLWCADSSTVVLCCRYEEPSNPLICWDYQHSQILLDLRSRDLPLPVWRSTVQVRSFKISTTLEFPSLSTTVDEEGSDKNVNYLCPYSTSTGPKTDKSETNRKWFI